MLYSTGWREYNYCRTTVTADKTGKLRRVDRRAAQRTAVILLPLQESSLLLGCESGSASAQADFNHGPTFFLYSAPSVVTTPLS